MIDGKDSVIRHWLRAGASGWRLDVADELPDEFIARLRSAMDTTKPGSILLAEVWEDGSNKIAYSKRRKYLLGGEAHGLMNYPFRTAALAYLRGGDAVAFRQAMIGRFIDQILPESSLPETLTSYSPCFRKEKGAHGIEERGIYRIHQFEKQEMIVVCKPEESKDWYEKLWKFSVELFRSMDIPVRQLECCSGDLADLKVKSCDIEAWSPRQQKYFEVCSCSNLGDAQARRLRIRYKDQDGKMQLCHTLNNTCVAPPRMLIAFLENNLQADGTVLIPEILRPYMGGKEKLTPKSK